jgi:cysteine synthase
MRIIDSSPGNPYVTGVIVLTKSEAIQMVHELVNLVADAPGGSGGATYVLNREESMPMTMSRVMIAVKE